MRVRTRVPMSWPGSKEVISLHGRNFPVPGNERMRMPSRVAHTLRGEKQKSENEKQDEAAKDDRLNGALCTRSVVGEEVGHHECDRDEHGEKRARSAVDPAVDSAGAGREENIAALFGRWDGPA